MTNNNQNWKRTLLIIFSGQAFSLLSSAMVQFSLIWWLTDTTGSATVLSIASIVGLLPMALLGPFIGTYVDRYSRKLIMIAADSLIALASLVLALMFIFTEPSVATIYLVLFIRAVATAFHYPAMQASMPMIAPEDELVRVAGWNQLVGSSANIAGPVLGVTILTFMAIEYVLLIDVLGAIFANLALVFVRIPQPKRLEEEKAEQGVLKELNFGIKELLKAKRLFRISLAITLVTLVYIPVGTLFPLMVKDHFYGGAIQAGTVEAAFGVGMVVGSLILGTLAKVKNKVLLIGGSIVILGVGLAISGILPGEGFLWFVILTAVLGFTGPMFSGPYMAMVQSEIEPSVLGRVMSLLTSMMTIATPVGLFIAGPIAQALGVAMWFSISGVLIAIVGIGLSFDK